MTDRLRIARGLTLGLDFVTKTTAILAQRRKGKTYTANVLAEELAKAGQPWVALDPTGAWWGLGASADGKREGLDVVTLGGDHGVVALTPDAGRDVADLVVENPAWYVLDLSHFESNEAERKFATAFAERFYRRKAKARDAIHLFVDEADRFAPQRPGPGDQRMLGAFEAIVRRGGIRGIGTTLITQRAASLNKNVLEQLDVLIVLRVVGPNDRKAIDGYVSAYGSGEERSTLMDSLASLKLGEAWVWEPGAETPLFKRVKIRERRTFNSSATPKAGEQAVEPRKLSQPDLAELEGKLAAAVEQRKANDPAELRKEVNRLRRELDKRPEAEPERIEVPVLTDDDRKLLERVRKTFGEARSVVAERIGPLGDDLQRVQAMMADMGASRAPSRPSPARSKPGVRTDPVGHARRTPSVAPAQSNGDVKLRKGERKMLEVLIRHHPMRLTRPQLATLAKLSVKGGTFSTYFGTLKRHGLLDESAGEITATDAGFDALGIIEPPSPQSPEELQAMWFEALRAGERAMLEALMEVHPNPLTRDELAERIDLTLSGGTFSTYLGTLRRNGLVDVDGSEVRASDTLYLGAAA